MFYVQKQCSNLLEELPELTDDLEPHIGWMSTALGQVTATDARLSSVDCVQQTNNIVTNNTDS